MLINGDGGRGRGKLAVWGLTSVWVRERHRFIGSNTHVPKVSYLMSLEMIIKRTCVDIFSLLMMKLNATCNKFHLTAAVDDGVLT